MRKRERMRMTQRWIEGEKKREEAIEREINKCIKQILNNKYAFNVDE